MGSWGKVTATVLLVIGLVLHNAPYLVRDQAVRWFYQQGIEDARFRQLTINWFTGQIRLKGIVLTRHGYAPLRLDELQIDFDLSALLDKRLLIEKLSVRGVQGAFEQRDKQLWLGPLPLPAADAERKHSDSEETALPVQVGLAALTLSDIRWQTRWQQQTFTLALNQFTLSELYMWAPLTQTAVQLDGKLNGAPLKIHSDARPLIANPEVNLALNVDALPLDAVMALVGQPLRGRLTSDVTLTAHLNPLTVKAEGLLQLDRVQWQAQPEVQLSTVQWQGKANWQNDTQTALVAGELSLKGLDSHLPVPGQAALQAQLQQANWQGDVKLQLQDALKADGKGQLTLHALTLAQPAPQASAQSLVPPPLANLSLASLTHQHSFQFSQRDQQPIQLGVQQQLTLVGVKGQWQQVDVQLQQLQQQGHVSIKDAQWQFAQPSLQLEQLALGTAEAPLLAIDQLAATELHAQPEQATLQSVQLSDLQLSQYQPLEGEPRPLSRWPSLQVAGVQWQPGVLNVNSVKPAGGESWLQRDAQGDLPDIVRLQQQLARIQGDQTSQAEATSSTADSEVEPAALRIVLHTLAVEQPHQVFVTDYAVSPAFSFEGELSQLNAGPYDSEGRRPLDANLHMKLNGDGELTLDGTLDPRTLQSGGWTLDISGAEMPYLSPYSIQYTGYAVQSGQFNLKSSGTLAAGELKGENAILLRNFDIEPRSPDQIGKVTQRLSMPLETALMILEDSDENIKLDLSLSGSLDDPDFGYQSVINSLAGRGVKTAAVSFLTRSLQPYATLISLAQKAIDAEAKGTFITLQPVEFTAGDIALSRDMQGYMGKLAEMLKQRPAMRLKVCGNAVKGDAQQVLTQLREENKKREKPLAEAALQPLLMDRLQQLAEQRSDAVKAALAEQINKDRLFVCYPQPTPDSEESPAVTLGI